MDNSTSQRISLFQLILPDSNAVIDLAGRGEFTLGRTSDLSTQGGGSSSTVRADIDLSAYRAYEQGVSRRHAAIFIGNELATLTDLGSTNGTRLNGEVLPPFAPYVVHDSDVITLGKFKIQLKIVVV